MEQISRSTEDETDDPTKSPLLLTTELAVRLSTTVSTSIAAPKTHESINMRELLGEDAIGNFDQIIIDHDNDGSIIVTKKRKVSFPRTSTLTV